MNAWRKLQQRFRALFGKEKLDAEMDEELRSHIELRTQANIEAGMNPEEARFAALRQFGWTESIKEDCREQRGVTWLENLAQDIRYGARQLRTNPGFTAVAVLTLALGIGANTAIFSVANAVLWKMLPVVEPEQLVFLDRYADSQATPWRKFCEISYPLMQELERRSPQLVGATTFNGGEMLAGVPAEAVPVKALRVAGNFYSLLGVGVSAGRTIQPGDIGGEKVVVLSHSYWLNQFGVKPVIGTSMTLDGTPHTIIGVTAREFFGLNPGDTFDVSVPLSEAALQMGARPTDPNVQPLFWIVARLKPNVSRADAAHGLLSRGNAAAHVRANGRRRGQPAHRENSPAYSRPEAEARHQLRQHRFEAQKPS